MYIPKQQVIRYNNHMTDDKKIGRPKADDPQNKGFLLKFSKGDLQEGKAVAKSEGFTFSAWVKMLIKREIKRVERRKKKRESGDE